MTRYLTLLVAVVGSLSGWFVAFDFDREENENTVSIKAFLDPNQDRPEPVNTTYNVTVDIQGTDGKQPDLVTGFEIFIAALPQLQRNGTKFPYPCTKDDIDGKETIPSKCDEALIATGTATANAGAAGRESLGDQEVTLKLFNASGGHEALLVVDSDDDEHPIDNEVIVGQAKEIAGEYRWVTIFDIPDDLQTVPDSLIPSVITHTEIKLGATYRGRDPRYRGLGMVQLITCPPSRTIPAKVVYHFHEAPTQTATTNLACKRVGDS